MKSSRGGGRVFPVITGHFGAVQTVFATKSRGWLWLVALVVAPTGIVGSACGHHFSSYPSIVEDQTSSRSQRWLEMPSLCKGSAAQQSGSVQVMESGRPPSKRSPPGAVAPPRETLGVSHREPLCPSGFLNPAPLFPPHPGEAERAGAWQ